MPGAWQGALCFIASDRRACVRICGQIWPLRPSEAWLLPRPVRRVGKSGFFFAYFPFLAVCSRVQRTLTGSVWSISSGEGAGLEKATE